ncbi:MAG: chromosomal replication initiator protein DnaA [Candidatus Gastranaerophilaceae bacterium]
MLNLNEKWTKVLEILKEEIPGESYNTWVLPLVPSSYEDNKLTLFSPHSFTAVTLKQSYGNIITAALTKVFREPVNFEIIQDKNLAENFEKAQKRVKKEEQKKTVTEFAESKYDGLKQMLSDCHLNTKYQFDNFVVGSYNKLAFGAALGVAEGKGKFNPLFIYGGSGLGKTHLMQAIGNYVLAKRKLKVRYVTTEEFLNDLLENLYHGVEKDTFTKGAEKNKRMTKFRQKYRSVDVLLIDDIQFVAGKARMEEELFNIFDALHQAGRQIVLTSDRVPSEIKGISDRLKTRFEWGLMADIGVPDLETRMAILKQLIDKEGQVGFSLEVIEFLASVYKNNIRELEGAYNKVCAYCSIYGEEPSLEIVKKAINYEALGKKITIDFVVQKTSEFFGIKSEDIVGSSRVAAIAYARKAAVYAARELTGESWQSIGAALGNRKHSTIMYSYTEVKENMARDNKLCDEINTLFNIINQS